MGIEKVRELTKWEVDQMGIDEVGIDKVGIDKVGIYVYLTSSFCLVSRPIRKIGKKGLVSSVHAGT